MFIPFMFYLLCRREQGEPKPYLSELFIICHLSCVTFPPLNINMLQQKASLLTLHQPWHLASREVIVTDLIL